MDELAAAAGAGGYSNRGPRQLQKLRQELNACLVGTALKGRRSECQLERVADLAGGGVFAGTGMDPNGKDSASGSLTNRNHWGAGLGPKMAVPRRTQVEPSSM